MLVGAHHDVDDHPPGTRDPPTLLLQLAQDRRRTLVVHAGHATSAERSLDSVMLTSLHHATIISGWTWGSAPTNC
jgi:hypothetical protein